MKLSRRNFLSSAAAFAAAVTALPAVRRVLPISDTAPTFVNVLDFGADPSGRFDSTEAIRTAIAALGDEGGTVFFPSGVYRAPPPIPVKIVFEGATS